MKETVLPYRLIKTLPQLLCFLTILLLSSHVYAACSNPAGTAGEIIYNSSGKVFQYCDDTNWLRMNQNLGAGSGGCTNPTANEVGIVFNVDQRVVQGCSGNVWRAFGSPGGHHKVVGIGTGFEHSCMIKEGGHAYCWGDYNSNAAGQLGDGTQVTPALGTYVAVAGGYSWKQIAPGRSHTCGIQTDDTLWCWGSNLAGRTGLNINTGNTLVPTQVSGGGTYKQVAVSNGVSCGLRTDDTLWCWGSNQYGNTGQNTTSGETLVPTQVVNGGSWNYVAVGDRYACGIRTDETLWCWGENNNGKTGLGTSSGTALQPTQVSGGGSWQKVSATQQNATCGIQTSGALYCWGWNYYSTTGQNTTAGNTLVPTEITGSGTWLDVDVKVNVACGIKSDNSLWCWGSNGYGALGNDSLNNDSIAYPVAVTSTDSWQMVKTSYRGVCGITEGQTMKCFGDNDNILKENVGYILYPHEVEGGMLWTDILATGWDYYYDNNRGCGITVSGDAYCWGRNEYDTGNFVHLGIGPSSITYSPIPVLVAGSQTWQKIEGARYATCGLRTDGAVMCWGYGTLGRLGNGVTSGLYDTPQLVSGGHSFIDLDLFSGGACAIRDDNAAMCWGSASSGKLGNGTTTPDQSTPVLVSGGHSFEQITASRSHTCGLRTDGVAMCWGGNGGGRLGDGTTTSSSVPVTVSGGHTWSYISAGYIHTCGVRTDGVAMCWGSDWGDGNLGDGLFTSSSVPVVVAGGYTWEKVVAGGLPYACGIRLPDRAIMCWGFNDGQFGDGTYNSSGVPVLAARGSAGWVDISLGEASMCALSNSGRAYCWGYNYNGELGMGSNNTTRSPELADCISPVGQPGDIVYNSSENIMQYCDGLGWVGMGK